MKILLADDDENLQLLYLAYLSKLGLAEHTLLYSSAHEVEQFLLENQLGPIQLAILDVNMPGKTGLELLTFIRAHFGRSFPVVMLSAYGDAETISTAFKHGADGYFVKPFPATGFIKIFEVLKDRFLDVSPVDGPRPPRCNDVEFGQWNPVAV